MKKLLLNFGFNIIEKKIINNNIKNKLIDLLNETNYNKKKIAAKT